MTEQLELFGQMVTPAYEPHRARWAWILELRAKYAGHPSRIAGCPGCSTFGLCALHAPPARVWTSAGPHAAPTTAPANDTDTDTREEEHANGCE